MAAEAKRLVAARDAEAARAISALGTELRRLRGDAARASVMTPSSSVAPGGPERVDRSGATDSDIGAAFSSSIPETAASNLREEVTHDAGSAREVNQSTSFAR